MGIILAVILVGTIGFKIIGGPEKSFLDALFMTAITITTVGYGDVIGLDNHPLGKVIHHHLCFYRGRRDRISLYHPCRIYH